MSTSNNNVDNQGVHPQPLIDALLACSRGPTAASTARLTALATSNNPRFWDQKIRSEQWFDTNGKPFSIVFPAVIVPLGKHSRLDPYFSLPILKQPELKDVHTVKAQFELRTLDESYPPEAVVCSKKAANTLMYLVSKCEKGRGADNREVIRFLRSAGSSASDPLHFVVHTDHLFPQAGEVSREVVHEFSLEDFENTDLTLSGNVLKERFAAKKGGCSTTTLNDEKGPYPGVIGCGETVLMRETEIRDWKLKDMDDPHGHLRTVMNLYNVDDVPVVVPEVCDAAGALIHPSEYSKKFGKGSPVAIEVVMRFKWQTGSQIYQTCLKSLHLLPMESTSVPKVVTDTGNKGKRKAEGPAGQGSPAKKGMAQQKAHNE
ncbi:hypothetical protein EV702DRAFT_1040748 [Suillus placidus]|uniref:Uncharacterized protein n=1 Tax=Suillus placidus TaxID=48579 RepID=A0A9P7A5S5_9AGAM|nr:hypothetical protein EV702DRAFT_1040748 [Suillus placidus]